jgi:hypothetical protein
VALVGFAMDTVLGVPAVMSAIISMGVATANSDWVIMRILRRENENHNVNYLFGWFKLGKHHPG